MSIYKIETSQRAETLHVAQSPDQWADYPVGVTEVTIDASTTDKGYIKYFWCYYYAVAFTKIELLLNGTWREVYNTSDTGQKLWRAAVNWPYEGQIKLRFTATKEWSCPHYIVYSKFK